MVTRALNSSPLLQFLTKSIEDRKCELSKPVALCIPMPDAKVEAAYHVGRRQVVVNSLVVSTQQDAIRLLLHELTHAYDACRVYLDPSDCRHAACTEVRASNLSTECNWRHEWFGTNRTPHLGLQAQQKECVQRRATASIQGVPGCTGKDCAEVVKSVFDRCYADTSPFPRTPI